jgi:hypothetical protein
MGDVATNVEVGRGKGSFLFLVCCDVSISTWSGVVPDRKEESEIVEPSSPCPNDELAVSRT